MMRTKTLITLLVCITIILSCGTVKKSNQGLGSYQDEYIIFEPISLTENEKQILRNHVNQLHERYDPEAKMLTRTLTGYNYHTDAEIGVFHEVRASFSYAVALLDLGDDQYTQRAFDIIKKTITLQDQDTSSRSCGVWPYYLEEPLATKKSPIDFNWADFNAVSLLDVWMGHQERIPEELKKTIKESLILAAKSVQRRNVGPSYTNIAIMGTYVTYLVSHLFDLPEMQEYANNRLHRFYDYTLEKGGFSEYNSPTYTIVSLDELHRMQRHIINEEAKTIIDALYSMGWEMIARHYHNPSGQWAGPHSRSYSTLTRPSFYAILNEASNGALKFPVQEPRWNVKIKHKMPDKLLSYFLTPTYPRSEIDIFEVNKPEIIGTSYLTEKYALSTANRSSLWNQRRPFLVYWGDINKPKYIQIRFLHDLYDFSSATFFSQQKDNKVLAGINFVTDGGDKHISIDRLKDGQFIAKDLRLRFEFGNVGNSELEIPSLKNNLFSFKVDDLQFNIQLYLSRFDGLNGHWEKGGDDKNSWIDFVIYSGGDRNFNLSQVNEAILGYTFSIGTEQDKVLDDKPAFIMKNGIMNASWNELELEIPIKPLPRPNHL
jgi:hypothetical protein